MAYLGSTGRHQHCQALNLFIATTYCFEAFLTSYVATHLHPFYTCFTDSSHNWQLLAQLLDSGRREVTNTSQVAMSSLFGGREHLAADFCTNSCFLRCSLGISALCCVQAAGLPASLGSSGCQSWAFV